MALIKLQNKWIQRVQARQPCFTFIVLKIHYSDHFGVPVNLIFWTCRLGSLLAISLCGIHVHFFVIVSLSFPVVVFLSLMQMSFLDNFRFLTRECDDGGQVVPTGAAAANKIVWTGKQLTACPAVLILYIERTHGINLNKCRRLSYKRRLMNMMNIWTWVKVVIITPLQLFKIKIPTIFFMAFNIR